MNGYIGDIVPYNHNYPMLMEENPISAIARRSSREAASVMREAVRARIIESRLSTMRSTSKDQSDIACTWLNKRVPGERNIAINTAGDATDGAFFFPRGERVRMRTVVNIW